jgi:ribosomal protein S18 acetylase RimI-like enzyme
VTAHPADPTHVLDEPVRAALLGPHAHLAERRGRVLRYPVDVCPFLAFPDHPGEDDWRDLADLAGPGEVTGLAAAKVPDGWEVIFRLDGVQMVDDGIPAAPDPDAVELGPADVPEMLDLVERTRPGPFRPATITIGTYLGFRDASGALIAMAGERMRPPGWTEISAVCTDPAHRGGGLATRLVRAVGAVIRDRGDVPFLHTTRDNTGAIRVYEAMGFVYRRSLQFAAYQVP